jgi:ectoine hydroxylase-related dioxygenase (phytanoyl-CoA dioxygenase family)
MNRAPLRPILEAEAEAYDRDGVVALRGMFDADWVAFMGDAVDAAMRAPGPHAEIYTPAGGRGRFFGDLDLWQRHPAFRRFVFESPAAEVAATVMRSSCANFFYDQLLVKEPGTAERTPWHQDQPYWAVDGDQVCSVWLPFDPVPAAGCPEYVLGSHRWNRWFNPAHFADGSPYVGTRFEPLPDIEADRARYDIRAFDLEPGDCLIFQALIVHGAPGNASAERRRRALSTRWTGDDARYTVREGEVAIPTSDPGLRHGDRMDCALFPRIWPTTEQQVTSS